MVRRNSTGVLGTTIEKRPPEGADGRCPAALKRLVPGKYSEGCPSRLLTRQTP